MKQPFFNIAFLALITTFSAHGAVTEKTLETEARKEGMLQITSNKLLYADVLLEAFSKRYPWVAVKHDKFDAATMDGFDNFESHDPADRSDVILRCQDKDLVKWIHAGWMANLDNLPNWKTRPRALEDDKRYVYFIGSPHVLVYNPEKISESELPSSYDDLLDPKWKSKLVMRNPLAGNSPAFFVQFINAKHGGSSWLEKFGKNTPLIAVTGEALHAAVAKGDYPVGLSRDIEVMTHNRDHGYNLKYKFIENELPYQYQLGLMSARAPHKATARLFMNWLLSKEAQEVLDKNGFSVGERQKAALGKSTTWRWHLTKGGDYFKYKSGLFEAQRSLKHGGATMQEKFALSREEMDAESASSGH